METEAVQVRTSFADRQARRERETQLYRREEVARILGISLRAADELILTKQLASLKIGKRRLVSEDSLRKFIRRMEQAAR